jgi:hypothetical protein
MKVDPKVTMILGIITTLSLAIGQGTIHLTGAVPDTWIPVITGWAAIISTVNSAVLTALAAISSKQSGPLSSDAPK